MKVQKKTLACLLVSVLLISACQTRTETIVEDIPGLSELSEVRNESTDANLFIRVYESLDKGENLPVLILVPGGSGDSQEFEKRNKSAESLAKEGFTVVTFDPDGRGLSEGKEDYNGFDQQDGLKAVIEAVNSTGSEKIGLVTFSYGITMGSGVLARYPDLPVNFLMDWEGPANRDDTGGCKGDVSGHLEEIAECEDEAFWSEREASTFMSDITVPYFRIQSEKDHVQPDAQHAWLLLTAALNNSPWVRINKGEVNATYDSWRDLPLNDEKIDKELMTLISEQAHALFELD